MVRIENKLDRLQLRPHTVIAIIKPILFAFLTSTAVKKLVIDLLSAYAKSTDNTLDDAAVELVKKNLLPE